MILNRKKPNRIDLCLLFSIEMKNFTQTHLAEVSEVYSHDSLNRYFCRENFSGRDLYKLTMQNVLTSRNGIIIIDDTHTPKYNTKKISVVSAQWSGFLKMVTPGIVTVTTAYHNPETDRDYFVNFNLSDYKNDKITKISHALNQIKTLLECENLLFSTVLFDSYYGCSKILNYIDLNGKKYYTRLPENRIVHIKRDGKYQKFKIKNLILTEDEKKHGIAVKLNQLHENHFVKLFRMEGQSAFPFYVITNDVSQNNPDAVRDVYGCRSKIETLYKECKQYTGMGRCEARKTIIQKNHTFFSLFTLNCLKKTAYAEDKNVKALKYEPYNKYLKQQFKDTRLKKAFAEQQ